MRVTTAATYERVAELRDQGWTVEQISTETGLPISTVESWWYRVPNIVTTVGIQRRLTGLRALGWTSQEISDETGLPAAMIDMWCRHPPTQVDQNVLERLITGYRRLLIQAQPETPNRTAQRLLTRRWGWVSPIAYDRIDDPTNQPTGLAAAPQGPLDLADIQDLLHAGRSIHDLAAGAGVKPESLRRRLSRAQQRTETS